MRISDHRDAAETVAGIRVAGQLPWSKLLLDFLLKNQVPDPETAEAIESNAATLVIHVVTAVNNLRDESKSKNNIAGTGR